jgi:hypothetical protein
MRSVNTGLASSPVKMAWIPREIVGRGSERFGIDPVQVMLADAGHRGRGAVGPVSDHGERPDAGHTGQRQNLSTPLENGSGTLFVISRFSR